MRYKVTVLVPGETPMEDIALAVDELMAPYEITNIVGHQGPQAPEGVCRCGYVRARSAARALADEFYPEAELERDLPMRVMMAHMLRSMRLYERAFTLMRRDELHSPSCRVCAGTGRYPEGLVPEGKFDGVVFGGYYEDGWISGTPQERDSSRTPRLEDNLTTVVELLVQEAAGSSIVTCALVTPDGFWYESPRQCYSSADPEWQAFERGFLARLEANRACWAVGVECHS